jgi:hypothetical protein
VSRFLATFGVLLMVSFIGCCVASAGLQLVAWTRHKRPEVPIHPGAVWKPEGFFDEVGLFQMKLARRALLIGGVMFASHLILTLAGTALAGR